MSLIPFYLRHLRNMGLQSPAARLLSEEMMSPFARDPFFRDPFNYMRQTIGQLEKLEKEHSLEETEVTSDGKKVEVLLDVRKFKPDEIKVKTIGDEIVVEGKHEVKGDTDGWTRSHFERRFLLPEGFPAERVECHLDAGRLRLIAFRGQPLPEREVPIQEKVEAAAGKSIADSADADEVEQKKAANN